MIHERKYTMDDLGKVLCSDARRDMGLPNGKYRVQLDFEANAKGNIVGARVLLWKGEIDVNE